MLYAPTARSRKRDGTYAPNPFVVSRYAPLPPTRQPSLPTVSILNTEIEFEPADYHAGYLARREAGL